MQRCSASKIHFLLVRKLAADTLTKLQGARNVIRPLLGEFGSREPRVPGGHLSSVFGGSRNRGEAQLRSVLFAHSRKRQAFGHLTEMAVLKQPGTPCHVCYSLPLPLLCRAAHSFELILFLWQ